MFWQKWNLYLGNFHIMNGRFMEQQKMCILYLTFCKVDYFNRKERNEEVQLLSGFPSENFTLFSFVTF